MKQLRLFGKDIVLTRELLSLFGLQVFFWMAWSWGTYTTVYLQGLGFTSSLIGILNAGMSASAIFALTFWGMVSDKINSVKRTFMIVLLCSAVLMALFPLLPAGRPCSAALFIIGACIVNFPRSAAPVLSESLSVRSCEKQHLNYGVLRACGSVSFAIGSAVTVFLIPFVGVGSTFVFFGLLAVPCLIVCLWLKDPKAPRAAVEKNRVNPLLLFKDYHYTVLIIFGVVLYIAMSGELSFLSYRMAAKNIPIENFGMMLSFRALMEVPFLVSSMRLRRRFRLKNMLMVSILFMSLECLMLGVWADSYLDFIICVMVFGIGNGLFIGSINMYVFKLAPDHMKASAHSVFSSATSISAIAGNFIGGFLCEKIGSGGYYIFLCIVFLVSVVFFFLASEARKDIPNPGDVPG